MRNRTSAWAVLCLLAGACNIEHYEDVDDDDCFTGGAAGAGNSAGASGAGDAGAESTGGASAGGSTSTGGTGPGEAGAGGSGAGEAGSGGSGGATERPCDEESDCPLGFNCDFERGLCSPSDYETCGELTTEAACSVRRDCEPFYAGVNCSCGTDCTCMGGEPGCVCERFDFFSCESAAVQ